MVQAPRKTQSNGSEASTQTPLFGTDGIRGKAGELLTGDLAMQVGKAVGLVLMESSSSATKPIILGQDSRNSCDMLAMALSAGLTSAGLDVWHLGLCPTPAVAHLTQTLDAAGGVMISASHNPPEDNGIKVFGANGAKLPLTQQEHVEALLHNPLHLFNAQSTTWGRHYYRSELVETYGEAISQPIQAAGALGGLKIVLDLAWGAATRLATSVFQTLNAEVISLHALPNGDRINVGCGSTHLQRLQAAVLEHQADIGFAFDGDADRVLAIDDQGRVVDGDYILYLWGSMLHQRGLLPNQEIISTVMANLGFENAWKQQGGQLVRTAVGDQYVHAAMVERGAMLGGEQSGHILCPYYGVSGDGLLTALHLALLVKQSGQSLATLVDQSFTTYPQFLKNVRVEDRDRRVNWRNCDPLVAELERAELALGQQGRVLIRPSGTEPLIRVMVEAENQDLAHYWTETLVRAVQQHLV
jgi:phosphoglucosamine mutase